MFSTSHPPAPETFFTTPPAAIFDARRGGSSFRPHLTPPASRALIGYSFPRDSSSREVAGDAAAVDLAEPRLLHRADVLGERAAGAEAAAARHVARVGRLAFEREVERDTPAADARDGGQQRACVRVARLLVERYQRHRT